MTAQPNQTYEAPAGKPAPAEIIPGVWDTPQRILVLLAHPDDPEFFCGATLARWAAAGHHIVYALITCGDKGSKDRTLSSDQVCAMRQREQRAAAAVLGVKAVHFMGYPDGYVVPDLNLRRDVTRVIRRERPDILVTCDPTTVYVGDSRLNHPDHRAAGQVAVDAVYPAARDFLYFPELLEQEHLEPYNVREVWMSGTREPNVTLDVTEFWETKIRALYEHASQIGERDAFNQRMRSRLAEGSTAEHPRYEEAFHRVVLA